VSPSIHIERTRRLTPGARAVIAFAAVLLAVLSPATAQSTLQRFESVEPHMGTLVRITVYAATDDQARQAFHAGFDRIGALDDTLSDYKPHSELSLITARAIGHHIPISDDLFRVLQASQRLARETDGAFDVTQGAVVRLWREARKTGRVPDPDALKEARTRSGFQHLHLEERSRTVMFDIPGVVLDVGAIGKGYAASEALEAIARCGIASALVAVSGDLAFSAPPPGQRGWRIQVHTQDPAALGVPATLELSDAAVSTSGAEEQHLDSNGRRYSHVIDPSSGMGLVNDITVTVVARHGLDADGLDTAASVLGAERGLALIESHPGAAGLILQKTNGSVVGLMSTRFRTLVDIGPAFVAAAVAANAPQADAPSRADPGSSVVVGCVHGRELKLTRPGPFGTYSDTVLLRGSKQLMKALREHEGHEEELTGRLTEPKEKAGGTKSKTLGNRTKITVGAHEDRTPETPADPQLNVLSFRHINGACAR
jgi:FAD:protein FMN transferase